MERFSMLIKELSNAQQLTRSQMKNIFGGSGGDEGSGGCVYCEVNSGVGSGSTSCWYSGQSPSDLCSRVYPNGGGNAYSYACSSGCHMN